MKLKYFFYSVVVAFYLNSCNSNEKINAIYNKVDNAIAADKISIQIPLEKDSTSIAKPDWTYTYFRKLTTDLKLDSLQSGYHDLQIRIWLYGWMDKENDLIILTRQNKKWAGKHIIIGSKYDENYKQNPFIFIKEVKQISPKSGWDNLFKSLMDLDILTLPDMSELPLYKGPGGDGIDYVFEIATVTKYRMFHYWCPDVSSEIYKEAKNVVSIIETLQNEFYLKK